MLLNTSFEAFSLMHFLPVLVIFIFFTVLIFYAPKFSKKNQVLIGFLLSLIPLAAVLTRMIMLIIGGSFNYKEDLPLHLCRVVAFMLPAVMWTQNRLWIGVLYFFIVGGTLQAVITPELSDGPDSIHYYLYWLVHAWMVGIPIYAIISYKIHIKWQDFWRAVIYINGYLIIAHIINYILGSNYFYTMRKPPVESILDMLGPWPIYIFIVELIAVFLFLVLMIPFKIKKPLSG